jgi:succinyl-CoA:acetate CoA-transferase
VRNLANTGQIAYVDMHLSQVPFWIQKRLLRQIDLAIIEATAIDKDGNIIPPPRWAVPTPWWNARKGHR